MALLRWMTAVPYMWDYRGGLLRTTLERDIADFSPDSRSAADLTPGMPLVDVQAASGGGRR